MQNCRCLADARTSPKTAFHPTTILFRNGRIFPGPVDFFKEAASKKDKSRRVRDSVITEVLFCI